MAGILKKGVTYVHEPGWTEDGKVVVVMFVDFFCYAVGADYADLRGGVCENAG